MLKYCRRSSKLLSSVENLLHKSSCHGQFSVVHQSFQKRSTRIASQKIWDFLGSVMHMLIRSIVFQPRLIQFAISIQQVISGLISSTKFMINLYSIEHLGIHDTIERRIPKSILQWPLNFRILGDLGRRAYVVFCASSARPS